MPREDSPESRDVDMMRVDENPSPQNESESDAEESHVTTNGHLTEDKVEDGSSAAAQLEAETEAAASASIPAGENPIPSAEKDPEDHETSSATAERASPSEEARTEPVQATLSSSETMKQDKELARLEEVMKDISPQTAQKLLRSQWRLFLFNGYSEDHISFCLRAMLKNSNKDILDRVLRDESIFKEPLLQIAASKAALRPEQLARIIPDHVLADVVAQRAPTSALIVNSVLQCVTADQIESFLPGKVLNKVMAEGIRYSPALKLLGWLGKGERLGFRPDDVLDGDDESVEPNEYPPSRPLSGQGTPPAPVPMSIPVRGSNYPPPSVQNPYPPPPQHSHPHHSPPHHPPLPPSNYAVRPPFANPDRDPFLAALERNMQPQRIADQDLISQKEAQKEAQTHAKTQAGMQKDATAIAALEQRRYEAESKKQEAKRLAQEAAKASSSGPPWICVNCDVTLPTFPGYCHHRKGMPCQKPLPEGWANWKKFWCENCASGFTQSTGLNYHKMRKVCFNGTVTPPPPVDASPILPPTLPPPPPNSGPNGYYPRPKAPPRPPLHTPSQAKPSTQPSPSQATVTLPTKPPLSTPSYPSLQKVQEADDIRVSPSDLPLEKRALLDAEIQKVDDRYEQRFSELAPDLSTKERSRKISSLKNMNTSQKSQIRKKYGVSLRLRDRDKRGRISLGLDTPSQGKRKNMTDSSASGSPAPVTGFSPVNAPQRSQNGSPAVNGTPTNGSLGVLLNVSNVPSPSKRQRINERSPPFSTPQQYEPNAASRSYTASTGVLMLERSTEDAAVKFAKPTGIGAAQQSWFAGRGTESGEGEGEGTKENAIMLGDDTESDDEDIPAVAPTRAAGGGSGLIPNRGSTEEA